MVLLQQVAGHPRRTARERPIIVTNEPNIIDLHVDEIVNVNLPDGRQLEVHSNGIVHFIGEIGEIDDINEFYAEVIRAFGILTDWSPGDAPPSIETVGTAQALGYCALRAIHKLAYVCDMTMPEVISRLVKETPVTGGNEKEDD
jgi:hypothetical protein